MPFVVKFIFGGNIYPTSSLTGTFNETLVLTGFLCTQSEQGRLCVKMRASVQLTCGQSIPVVYKISNRTVCKKHREMKLSANLQD